MNLKNGKKGQPNQYKICTFNFVSINSNINSSINRSENSNINSSINRNINSRHIKTKTKTIKKQKAKTEENVQEEKSFDELIDEYSENLELRKELRNHLAIRKIKGALTNRSLLLGFHNLDALTNKINSEEEKTKVKIKIVQQSIRGGYPDFYPLKVQKKQEGGINYNYAQRKADEATLEQLYDN